MPSPLVSAASSPSALPTPMCDGLVKLSLRGGTIVANPETVCVAVGYTLTFEIVDKGTATITFEKDNNLQGPFPDDPNLVNHDGTLINAVRGIYEAKNPNTIVGSLNVKTRAAEDAARRWKYTVKWVRPDGTEVPEIDPWVCIRK
jgi:hypothetical protein